MKKLSPIAYRALFFKHVWRFIQNMAQVRELQGPHAVAVSGGLDSMTLLWLLQSLHQQGKLGPVRAIFVHHHTREGQEWDAELIRSFCRQLKVPFKQLDVDGLTLSDHNFEARARKERRALCLGELRPHERLWLGHHLDDSYEWNLMQRSRSTNPRATLGIPARNGPILRPFLCVTRRQIERLARFEGIPFREDPTNFDLRFERNYVRHQVIPLLRRRFPKMLKHYAHLSNFAAMQMGLSVITRGGPAQIYVYDKGAVLLGKHFTEIQVQEIIHSYSDTDRGELITPIQRMLKAIDNGKKGPFHFSGNVAAYYTTGLLMIYCQNTENYDASVARILGSLSGTELGQLPTYKRVELEQAWKNLLNSPDAMLNMPGLVLVLESESICKTLNCSVFDPTWPEVSAVCKANGYRFSTYVKCLETWRAKKDKLPEKLRLLPLCNLSNLFASQQNTDPL
jgi:tRNA(Ile)-lysidine synthase